VFLVNSRLDRFTAAPSSSARKGFTLPGRPFSRSYGANLPSSLTRVISITLVFSTCPPVSVWVRARASCLEAFLGGMASETRRPSGQLASHLAVTRARIYLDPLATCLPLDNLRQGSLSLPRPPIGHNGRDVVREYQPVGHRLRLSASP
jgi:hypothetical protein